MGWRKSSTSTFFRASASKTDLKKVHNRVVSEQHIVIAIYCNTILILKGIWRGCKTIAIYMEGISTYNNIAIVTI